MKIDKDQIIAQALLLLNERGLDGVTTRALADRLGVKQPALYWHFADRRALLDAMNDAIEAQITLPPLPVDTPWQAYVLALGQAFRAGLLAYRDGARVHAGTRANRAQLERHMQVLVTAGLPIPLAIQLLVSVGRFVVGWVLEEQAEQTATIPPQAEGLAGQAIRAFFDAGDDASFNAGLQMLITGAGQAAQTP
jgi:TetR/AcrR family tetracycline transcriptional repressor